METNEANPEPDCSTASASNSKNLQWKYTKSKQNKNNVHKNKESRANSKEDGYIQEKLACITAPTTDLPALIQSEQKFSGRSRLFIGNLTSKVTEEDINTLFKKFGEISDTFLNANKNFGFIKLDYYVNALKAKSELNGYNLKGRNLIIRFAHPAAVMVKNLPDFVSDELLHLSFSIFGEIEKCTIIIDDRGKSSGRGIIEFVKKSSATLAINRCSENCYFLTSSLKPVIVENYEPVNDTDGLPESMLRKTTQYYQARDVAPRLALPGSFEYRYGKRWKELRMKYKEKVDALKNELVLEERKLEADMKRAQYDHETERLKEMLRLRELEKDRFKQEWEMRRRQLENDNFQQNEVGRLRQQETLYMQANQLSRLLDTEERQLHAHEQWSLMSHGSQYSYPETSSLSNVQVWKNQSDADTYNSPKRFRR